MNEAPKGYDEQRAELYARQMEGASRDDVSFYVERAMEADGPVLELACGTGRIYLEILKQGVSIDGIDASEAALDVLREAASERDLDPSVWQADMSAFETDRTYELVICPFNSFQHLLSIDEQLTALQCIYDAIAPGGRFIFDVFVPRFDVICDTYGEWTVESISYPEEGHEYHSRTTLADEVEQQFTVENKLVSPDNDVIWTSEHQLKMLPRREVELLTRLSPFSEWRVTGNFEDRMIRDDDSVQVWELGR